MAAVSLLQQLEKSIYCNGEGLSQNVRFPLALFASKLCSPVSLPLSFLLGLSWP